MENFIESENLNLEIIQKVLEDAALQPTVDDGDLYISREAIDFGCWVRYIEDAKLINFFTYAKVKEGVNQHQMYELPTLFGTDKRFIVATLRRFSGAFLAGLQEDKDDIFFD